MKRILFSLLSIAAISGMAFALTRATFTDTEVSKDNTFDTGTIDIAVDGSNPWTTNVPYNLTDMKPSQVGYIDFVVHNVGTNPVNLSKSLTNFAIAEVAQSESKCFEIGGQWNDATEPKCTGGNLPLVTDMKNTIKYDLRVELYSTDPTGNTSVTPYWWETIYLDSDDVRLNNLPASMYLGMIPVDHYMKVIQSYHMDSATGNNYQGEKLTFDIVLDAEQLTGTLRLEDKYLPDSDVSHHVWFLGGLSNGKDATLTYGVKDDAFNYTLSVEGMPDGPYTLIAWEPTSYVWPWGTWTGTTMLADVTVAGSNANVSGSIDLQKDLINAKVWLVPGDLGIPGQTG